MPADAWSRDSASDTFSSGEDAHEEHVTHADGPCTCHEDFDYELERSIRERMQSRPGGAMIASYQEAIPNYVTIEGLPLPGALITKTFDKIKTFEARPDDVIIAGYPRSGNHWLKEIVTQLYLDELSVLPKHVYDRMPILEMAVDVEACMKKYLDRSFERYGYFKPVLTKIASTIGMRNNDKFVTQVHLDTLGELENRASPRLYHTHLPFHMLPDQVKDGKCKILVILRNGKDVASSYFEMHKMYPPFGYYGAPQAPGDWHEFLYTFLNGKVCFGSWFDHSMGFWAERHRENLLFIRYEDMIENPPREVKRVSDFLGRYLTPKRVEEIVAHCSFEKMRTNPHASYDSLHGGINTKETKFLRKGKVGDWKSKMTVEDSEFFDMIYRHKKMHVEDGPNLRFDLY